jgi:hypothetical protein
MSTERKHPQSNQSTNLEKSVAPPPSFCTLENPNPDQSTVQLHQAPHVHDPILNDDELMANFEVDPAPYIPTGFDIEQWACPARGRVIVADLPLVQNRHAVVPFFNNRMDKECDYPIFQLAKTMNLHQVFGPSPSAQMLIQDILHAVSLTHHDRYIQRPLSIGLPQFGFVRTLEQINVDPFPGFKINWRKHPPVISVDPNWGNNWEASSSSAPLRPKLQLIQ